MKTLTLDKASPEVGALCDSAQSEQIIFLRGGKPFAVVVGLGNFDLRDYDAEDIGYMTDLGFWRMIAERRRDDSDLIPFEQAEARIAAQEETERKQVVGGAEG